MARFLPYLSPLLLACVAAMQLYLAHARDLSPWKGGGFGMFSTVDSPSARFVRVYLSGGGLAREVPIGLPPELRRDERLLRTLPRPTAARELARRLAAMRWTWTTPQSAADYYRALQGQEPAFPSLPEPCEPGAPERPVMSFPVPTGSDASGFDDIGFDSLRLEVWRYRFDPEKGGSLAAAKLLEVTESRLPTPKTVAAAWCSLLQTPGPPFRRRE